MELKRKYDNFGFLIGIIGLLGLFISSCNVIVDPDPWASPEPPRDVVVIPGDNAAEISWKPSPSRRIAGYNVYRSRRFDGVYSFIGSTNGLYFIDYSARNGIKYYYAVTAYDSRGNESKFSYDYAFTIPRPEGYDILLEDFRLYPDWSGFEFASAMVLPFDDLYTDIFFEYTGGAHYMNVWDDTDIQDMGYTHSLKDVTLAPVSGWSQTKDVRLRHYHTYVVWTWDDRFAKFRVVELGPGYVVFDYAYQTIEGERLLKRDRSTEERAPLQSKKFNIGVE